MPGAVQTPVPLHKDAGIVVFPVQEAATQTVPTTWLRQAPAPSHLPSRPQVAGAVEAQRPRGSSDPAGTLVQVPKAPTTLHALHEPQVGDPQHTPSTQLPDAHSRPPVQICPRPLRFPQILVLTPHRLGAAHSLSVAQDVWQALMGAVALQANGAQGCVAPAVQVPAPSQAEGKVRVNPSARHALGAQTVPAGNLRQAPAPSHLPSRAQVVGRSAAQLVRGSALPAATGAQAPTKPATLQARQGPQVMAPQHTPSTQFPEEHCVPAVQAIPADFSPQVPPVQTLGGAQSASVPHALKQALLLHR